MSYNECQEEYEGFEEPPKVGLSDSKMLLEREKPFKWGWMMNYCKLHGIPPAQEWAWKRAEQAFIHAHGDQ